MSTTEALYTPDDLLAMPDGDRYELVDGRLVERNVGTESDFVSMKIIMLLGPFAWQNRLGTVHGPDASYQCFPNGKVRKPDASFIARGRFPGGRVPVGHVRFAPDLAVEVVSPTDVHYETDRKVEEYLQAGVRLAWVVNPEVRTVLIYRADGSISGLREGGELDGEGVVPGFRCPVADLFATLEAP